MAYAKSDLDFSVLDRAKSLGDLLRLCFALLEAFGPKDVADLLTYFDGESVIDPETAGRWLRNERRPSKSHLRLIVRVFQAGNLMGSPPARDPLFIRIASHYAQLEIPGFLTPRRRTPSPATPLQPPLPQVRHHLSHDDYEAALALQADLDTPGEEMPRIAARLFPLIHSPYSRVAAISPVHSQGQSNLTKPMRLRLFWKRIVQRLLGIVG